MNASRSRANQARSPHAALLLRLALAGGLVLASAMAVMASDPASGCLQGTANPEQGGTVTMSPSTPCPPAGSTVTFTAVPATGGTFAFWSEGASGTANPVTVTVPATASVQEVQANFTGFGDNFDDVAQLDGPQDGTDVAGTVEFLVKATSPGSVTSANFYLDGHLSKTATAAPFSYAVNADLLAPGLHRLDVLAQDYAGRPVAQSREFVALAAPTITKVKLHHAGGWVLKVFGTGFASTSKISVGTASLAAAYKAKKGVLVYKDGKSLRGLFPKGTAMCVKVVNADGQTSACFMYTRH